MILSAIRRVLDEHVDPAIARVLAKVVDWEIKDPLRWRLADHRRAALGRTVASYARPAATLADAVVARDPAALRSFDALVADAFAAMRADRPVDHPVLGAIERRLYRQGAEILDDPTFPVARRAKGLARLHRMNEALKSYDGFVRAILPLVERAEALGRAPVRIHDLAAGHGGFAVLLKQRLGDRVRVEASDLVPEYLEIGRRRARELGVEVDFHTQDALDLDAVKGRGVDVLLCTQSIHHFEPGMVARMIGEAARAAQVGVCLVDAERSWLMYALYGPAAALYGRSYVLLHDGLVSLRRMFYEEELALFAALAPGLPPGAVVETGAMLPAHAWLRITRSGPIASVAVPTRDDPAVSR